MSAALRITLASFAIAGLALVGAAPASAAARALPATDSMYAIACDDGLANMQLLGVDASTGASTEIGTGDGTIGCAGQPAWDATTSTAYYVMFDFPQSILATMNTSTGSTTSIGIFTDTIAEPDETPFIQAIAIGLDGAAYAFSETDFYSLDLATAELTQLGSASLELLGFAVDPTSGVFYAVDISGDVYSVNVTNGVLTAVDTADFGPDVTVYSLQIDSAGTFWFASYEETIDALQLWSTTATVAGTEELSGVFERSGGEYFHEALLVTPGVNEPAKPALADTGADATSTLVIGASALGALVLGAVLLATRRRTRGA